MTSPEPAAQPDTTATHSTMWLKSLAAAGVILLMVGTVGYFTVSELKRDARYIATDTLPGLAYAGAANAGLGQGFNRTLLLMLPQSPQQYSRYRQEIDEFNNKTLASLEAYRLGITSEEDRAHFESLMRHREKYIAIREQTLSLLDEKKQEEALALCNTALLPAYDTYKEAGEVLLEYNARQGKIHSDEIMAVALITQIVVALTGIAMFVAGFFTGLFK